MCGMSRKLPRSLDLGNFWHFPLDFPNILVISFEYQPANTNRWDRGFWFCSPVVPMNRKIDAQISGVKSNAFAN